MISKKKEGTYLVGVSMSANSREGASNKDWRIGKAKEPVLPEPVSARPITSRPVQYTKINSLEDLTNTQCNNNDLLIYRAWHE